MKKMRLIFLSIVALLASYSLYAQQDAQLTQHMAIPTASLQSCTGRLLKEALLFLYFTDSQWLGYLKQYFEQQLRDPQLKFSMFLMRLQE